MEESEGVRDCRETLGLLDPETRVAEKTQLGKCRSQPNWALWDEKGLGQLRGMGSTNKSLVRKSKP